MTDMKKNCGVMSQYLANLILQTLPHNLLNFLLSYYRATPLNS